MGAADVVPGVSGGTIAFISGIYTRLLEALSSIPAAALLLLRGRIVEAWRRCDATFLSVLLAGMLTSFISLARVVTWLLHSHPIPLWSFFFGLVLISCLQVGKSIEGWSWKTVLAFAIGGLCAWYITVAAPISWGRDYFSLFLAGAIAICAMVLPGISGSFLLLLMGLYAYVLEAVKSFDLPIIMVFALGCLCGLLLFSHLLKLALQWRRDLILALLTGFMLGSLNKVWPWKQAVSWFADKEGKLQPLVEEKLWPWQYAELTGNDAQLLLALIMMIGAVLLVLSLEKLASRAQKTI